MGNCAPKKRRKHQRKEVGVGAMKIEYFLALRFGGEMLGYISNGQMLKISLFNPFVVGNPLHKKLVIRGNRNIAYYQKTKYLDCLGVLGQGSFGVVELVRDRRSGHFYALKTISVKEEMDLSDAFKYAILERDAWLTLDSNYVVKLKAAWFDITEPHLADAFCVLCELMPRGSLSDVLEQLHPMPLTRTDLSFGPGAVEQVITGRKLIITSSWFVALARREIAIIKSNPLILRRYKNIIMKYFQSIIYAVSYIHDHDIVHQDLKPDNILVTGNLELKLADLGLCTPFKKTHLPELYDWIEGPDLPTVTHGIPSEQAVLQRHTYMERLFSDRRNVAEKLSAEQGGTQCYQGPELFPPYYSFPSYRNRSFQLNRHFAGDWYSVGVIFYELLTGLQPIIEAETFIGDVLDTKTKGDRRYLCRVNPYTYNRLFYGEDAYNTLVNELQLDRRFLTMVHRLIEPDYLRRDTGLELLDRAATKSFIQEVRTSEDPAWIWNEFRREPKHSKAIAYMAQNQAVGFQYKPAAGTLQLPYYGGFPVMTHSPGTAASPYASPLQRSPSFAAPVAPANIEWGPNERLI